MMELLNEKEVKITIFIENIINKKEIVDTHWEDERTFVEQFPMLEEI